MNFCLAHDVEEYDQLSVGNGLDPLPRHYSTERIHHMSKLDSFLRKRSIFSVNCSIWPRRTSEKCSRKSLCKDFSKSCHQHKEWRLRIAEVPLLSPVASLLYSFSNNVSGLL